MATSTQLTESTSTATDFEALVAESIAKLQDMAGQIWTDYNTHDPGVTILEQLCYALTDLAYRIGHPIEDLLADPDGSIFAPELYRARGIMSTSPIAPDDYRRLLIGLDGIRNARIELADLPEPLLTVSNKELVLVNIGAKDENGASVTGIPVRGMMKVSIEPDGSVDETEMYNNAVGQVMACRNIGEDFIQFEVMKPELVRIDAKLEVAGRISATELLVEIGDRLSRFISPEPVFYTLDEMLRKGYTTDELMDGPVMGKGYIDPEEFNNFNKREYLRGSDLISVLSEIPGVRYVKELRISLLDDSLAVTQSDPWTVTLNGNRYPQLYVGESFASNIILMRGDFTLTADDFNEQWANRVVVFPAALPPDTLDVMVTAGRYRYPGEYQSIQHHFPLIYGIGEGGLSFDASPQTIALAKQLKAYLLFFEQVLCDAFGQLEGFRTFISYNNPDNSSRFRQVPDDVPDLDSLLIGGTGTLASNLSASNDAVDNSSEESGLQRVANHLLARVGEQVYDYSLLVKKTTDTDQFLNLKKKLLAQFQDLSTNRAKGIDYIFQTSGAVSALQKRINILLDIADDNPEGERFCLLEHQLLRPLAADLDQYIRDFLPGGTLSASPGFYISQPAQTDIFSLQISFVFPGWVERFSDPNFRSFAERLIFSETPAHLKAYVFWLEEAPYTVFESAFLNWQGKLAILANPIGNAGEELKDQLLQVRITRNSVIDSMVACLYNGSPLFGYTYPVLDLPAKAVADRVQEGEIFQAAIDYSQPGLQYQLWDRVRKTYSGAVVDGTGATLYLNSDIIVADKDMSSLDKVEFDISVRKISNVTSWLQTIVSAEFRQLAWDLKVELSGTNEITYDSQLVVRIYTPQTNVYYTLYTSALKDSDYEYFYKDTGALGYKISDNRFLETTIVYTRQDTLTAMSATQVDYLDIVIPAGKKLLTIDQILKIGASFGGTNTVTEFLDARVCVFVGPNTGVTVSKVTDDNSRVQIKSPQPGVLYTLIDEAGKAYSSSAMVPGKALAGDEKDADKHMRVAVDFVINAITVSPVELLVPAITKTTTFYVTAQKLNTQLMATLASKVKFDV